MIHKLIIRFLILLPDCVFQWLAKQLSKVVNLFHVAAKRELEINEPENELSTKHLWALYNIYKKSEQAN